jgi:hypothetical protein
MSIEVGNIEEGSQDGSKSFLIVGGGGSRDNRFGRHVVVLLIL